MAPGKTSLPRVFIEAIGGEYATIPVQSSWRDRHELLGYNNDFNKRFSETEFTKAIYRSGFEDQQERIWFVLLDEMNLARVEYYFADFLSVLEEPDPARCGCPSHGLQPIYSGKRQSEEPSRWSETKDFAEYLVCWDRESGRINV